MTRDIAEDVLHVFQRHRHEVSISPSWLATETMVFIEFPRELHAKGYVAAHAHYCQIARKICRREFTEEITEHHELFPDLQKRYPIQHKSSEEAQYILLDHLDERDGRFNVERLRAEAGAKLSHADALEAFLDSKFGRAVSA